MYVQYMCMYIYLMCVICMYTCAKLHLIIRKLTDDEIINHVCLTEQRVNFFFSCSSFVIMNFFIFIFFNFYGDPMPKVYLQSPKIHFYPVIFVNFRIAVVVLVLCVGRASSTIIYSLNTWKRWLPPFCGCGVDSP